MKILQSFFWGFIHLFFPEVCVVCTKALVYGESVVCTCCLALLPQVCTKEREGGVEEVMRKFYGRVPVWWGSALFRFIKGSGVHRLLHMIKYKGGDRVARMLGRYYGEVLREYGVADIYDVVVPVPLHSKRLRERGYNQSGLFAEGIADVLGLVYCESALVRRRYTTTQTKKGRKERWENVGQAFIIGDRKGVVGKRVLLVDDLITTGATLTACSKVLVEEGVQEVGVAVLAFGEED